MATILGEADPGNSYKTDDINLWRFYTYLNFEHKTSF